MNLPSRGETTKVYRTRTGLTEPRFLASRGVVNLLEPIQLHPSEKRLWTGLIASWNSYSSQSASRKSGTGWKIPGLGPHRGILQTVLEKYLSFQHSFFLFRYQFHSFIRLLLSILSSLRSRMMYLISILVLAAIVAAQKCPLQFDGRVPKDATLATFDGSSSPFNAQYVLGASK